MYRSRLSAKLIAHHSPAAVVHAATGSIAAADGLARALGGVRGSEILRAAQSSFTTAIALGMRLAGAVSVASALAALVVIPPRRRVQVAGAVPAEGKLSVAGSVA